MLNIPGKTIIQKDSVLLMLLECILKSEPGAVSFVGLFWCERGSPILWAVWMFLAKPWHFLYLRSRRWLDEIYFKSEEGYERREGFLQSLLFSPWRGKLNICGPSLDDLSGLIWGMVLSSESQCCCGVGVIRTALSVLWHSLAALAKTAGVKWPPEPALLSPFLLWCKPKGIG